MTRNPHLMNAAAIRHALTLRDLTDPAQGPHAMQLLLNEAVDALASTWGATIHIHRESPVVSVADNYDRLHYPPDGAARGARYTRYLNVDTVLRTQTSAMVPRALESLAGRVRDELLVCPGLVYRRDAIDRLHTGEPHQLDLWRLAARPLTTGDLREMVELLVSAVLPGRAWRIQPARHPYTTDGLQIDVRGSGEWVEIGECGLALPALAAEAGHDASVTGLAMGVGLDRILMLRKGIDDIRLLRSTDPRIVRQLRDLSRWVPVSSRPAIHRDLSIAVDDSARAEDLGDQVREALGASASPVESVEVLSETPYRDLPPVARRRLGMSPGQKNVLVRVVLRPVDRTLTRDEANRLRDAVYAAIHQGSVHQWATRSESHGRAAVRRPRGSQNDETPRCV